MPTIFVYIGIDPPFRGVYRKPFFHRLYVSHSCIGESLADQTVGNLTFFKGQRVFVDLAHASQDVNFSYFFCARLTLNHIFN